MISAESLLGELVQLGHGMASTRPPMISAESLAQLCGRSLVADASTRPPMISAESVALKRAFLESQLRLQRGRR